MEPTADKPAEETKESASNRDSGEDRDRARQNGGKIGELRRLLVGSEEVSDVLPEAVQKSTEKGTGLSEATLPIVEENIRESVIRNPKILADALFPVIGPAIRKAISAALSSMVQSFNQTLEHSVSPKGLRWRWEAFRTGRSFGEVVMLKTLRYRVEQVYLIHRKTGILLQHVAIDPQEAEDADMVSAMLTAITDFAHDSFETADDDATLDSFKISGLSVWIENSPDAILAAVIRGNPPLELREEFALAVEKIQYSFERELDTFEGDSEVFAPTQPVLERCLLSQAAETEKQGLLSPTNVMAGVLGLLVLLVIGYFAWDYWRWSGLLEDVRSTKGYVLTDYNRGWFTHSVEGLRDPLAGDPGELLSANGYDAEDVSFTWREFHDSDPELVLKRAQSFLSPPGGAKLSIRDGLLSVEGNVPAAWFADAAKIAPLINGIDGLDTESQAATIIKRIEGRKVMFQCGTTNVINESTVTSLIAELRRIASLGSYEVRVIGYADPTGTEEFNARIRDERAAVISGRMNRVLSEELSGRLQILGVGSAGSSDDCKVTLRVRPLKQ